jgi:hypothetical protein
MPSTRSAVWTRLVLSLGCACGRGCWKLLLNDQWKNGQSVCQDGEVLQKAGKTDSTSNMEQLKRKKDAKKVAGTYHCHLCSFHPFQMDLT